MYTKLVVLFVVIATVAAAPTPGFLGEYHVPVATSYTNRVDVHSKPIVTYTAPIVTKTLLAAPVAYGIHEPLVASYGDGHLYGGYAGYGGYGGYGHGLGYAHGLGYGHGYGYGHGW